MRDGRLREVVAPGGSTVFEHLHKIGLEVKILTARVQPLSIILLGTLVNFFHFGMD